MKSAIIILCLLSAAVLHAAPPGYVWHGKGDQSTRDKDGIYVWFVPGLSPLPGDYKVVGRLRSGHSGTFTLRAVDNFTGAERFSGAVKTSAAYADYEFGTLHYDGSWPIRLVDWNAPGYYIESVGLIPVNVPSVPEVRGSSADSSDGWIPMYHTKLAADPNMKKEGRGSLLVTVEPKSNVPWYDVGAMRRLNAAKATMISFWIRFDDTPKPVWIQLIGGKESAVMRFRPEEFGIVRGEWKLVELPVSSFHFKPERDVATDIHGVAICPETGKEKCVFRIDDLLLE